MHAAFACNVKKLPFTVTQWHQLEMHSNQPNQSILCYLSWPLHMCMYLCVCVCVCEGASGCAPSIWPSLRIPNAKQLSISFSLFFSPSTFFRVCFKIPSTAFLSLSLSFPLYDCLLSEFKWFVGMARLTSLLGNGPQEGIQSPQ